jgi:RNA polymerase-binding transcription factor DksA
MKTMNPESSALRVPQKWDWHYRKLQSLREALLADRADQMTEVIVPLESYSIDDADRAIDEANHNLTLGILSNEENSLFAVESAIQRILDGTYGICALTGKAIPEVRLRIVPWTQYTKEALECLERQHAEDRISDETPRRR